MSIVWPFTGARLRRSLAGGIRDERQGRSEYLLRPNEPERTALVKLRVRIRRARGRRGHPRPGPHGPLVHFAAQPGRFSFTVVRLDALNAVGQQLDGFEISGRTVRFSAKNPIPAAVPKRVVEHRIRENQARAKTWSVHKAYRSTNAPWAILPRITRMCHTSWSPSAPIVFGRFRLYRNEPAV